MITLARLGLLFGILANGALCFFWFAWSQGAWADCPNHPFGAQWYLAPPPIVLFLPLLFALIGLLLAAISYASSRRPEVARLSVAWGLGLALNGLPIVLAIVLPCASDLLHLTTPGC